MLVGGPRCVGGPSIPPSIIIVVTWFLPISSGIMISIFGRSFFGFTFLALILTFTLTFVGGSLTLKGLGFRWSTLTSTLGGDAIIFKGLREDHLHRRGPPKGSGRLRRLRKTKTQERKLRLQTLGLLEVPKLTQGTPACHSRTTLR